MRVSHRRKPKPRQPGRSFAGRPAVAGVSTLFFQGAPPRVFAHRGLTLEAPENTLHAFREALAIGVTHIETDVRASADGVAVLVHDADLVRIAGRNQRIDELTLAELREVDLGGGRRFPTLFEALSTFPQACFNIDLKSADVVEPAVAAILAAGAADRVLVTAFGEARRAAAVARLPGVATSASARTFLPALVAARLGVGWLVRFLLADVHAVQVPERALGLTVITPRTVRLFHLAAVEIHVWTINDAESMVRLLDLGVDGIVTDRSDLALAVIALRPSAATNL
jgi:glycerophosphoryl diester phosphodiesterase